MKNYKFSKVNNAVKSALVLGLLVSPTMVFAEETTESQANTEEVEVIQVRGIRGSVVKSLNTKRYSNSIVDAVTAEDIGKFPDQNVAESLQRITGVTVSRSNGEGSQITVRGFGPNFNLITLNGRQMPGTGNSRSYSLENLSSDGVSELIVNKTARAENPSGGLGATIDIVTMKPFTSPGEKFVFSGKGIYDS